MARGVKSTGGESVKSRNDPTRERGRFTDPRREFARQADRFGVPDARFPLDVLAEQQQDIQRQREIFAEMEESHRRFLALQSSLLAQQGAETKSRAATQRNIISRRQVSRERARRRARLSGRRLLLSSESRSSLGGGRGLEG